MSTQPKNAFERFWATLERNPQTVGAIILIIVLLLLFFTTAILVQSANTTNKVKNDLIRQIKLLNSPNSGLFTNRSGSTVFLENTGLLGIDGGFGIDVVNETDNVFNISIDIDDINCTAFCNMSTIFLSNCTCFNNITFFGNQTVGDCNTCDDSSCTCFNSTSNVTEFDTINITNIEFFNTTTISNDTCCTDNITAGIGITVSAPFGNVTINNTGVLTLNVTPPIVNSGSNSFPNLFLNLATDQGLNLTQGQPDILTNTGVLQGLEGNDISIISTYGNGTLFLNISANATESNMTNIDGGLGINVTQNLGVNTVTNDGVIQDIAGPGISLLSSFGPGKGVVTIVNAGVLNVSAGDNATISGTLQFPNISTDLSTNITINALPGIQVFQNSSQVFSILNTGVTFLQSSIPEITVIPNTGIANVSSTIVNFNITGGTGIVVSGNPVSPTIDLNLTAGVGIKTSIVGGNLERIVLDIAAGLGIVITPSGNQLTISNGGISGLAIGCNSTTPPAFQMNLNLSQVGNVYALKFIDIQGFSAVLTTPVTIGFGSAYKNLGSTTTPVWAADATVNYPWLFRSDNKIFNITSGIFTAQQAGWHFFSWNIQYTSGGGVHPWKLCELSGTVLPVQVSNTISNPKSPSSYLRSSGTLLHFVGAKGNQYALCIALGSGSVTAQQYYAFSSLADVTVGASSYFSAMLYFSSEFNENAPWGC